MNKAPRRQTDMADMPLGWRHIRIVLTASLGQFIGQGLATLVGIVIPLMQLAAHPELPAALQGLMGCISLIGIMTGTVVFGRLSDRYGYLLFFRLCPAVILAAALAATLLPHVPVLLCALFLMGFAIGGEYSLDPDYISELMPGKWRVFMVGVAKALASAGSAFVAVVCYLIITRNPDPAEWPSLFLIVAGIAALMLITRIGFAQSPQWLVSHGKDSQAETAVRKLLGPDAVMVIPPAKVTHAPENQSMWQFIKGNLAKISLTGIPWACEGLGVYGIGIFLPVLIMSFRLYTLPPTATPVDHITHSVMLTFVLCIVMMGGFACGILLLRRLNHIRMEIWGFFGSAVGLGILLAAYLLHWPAWIAIGGFILFELFLNAGPHLITFILPSHIYPPVDRGTGSGIAASLGKTGAVIGAFIIPVLLKWGGATLVLIVSIAVMALGALVTLLSARAVARSSSASSSH